MPVQIRAGILCFVVTGLPGQNAGQFGYSLRTGLGIHCASALSRPVAFNFGGIQPCLTASITRVT